MIKSPCKNCESSDKNIPICFDTCKKLKQVQEICSSDRVESCQYRSNIEFDAHTEFRSCLKGSIY